METNTELSAIIAQLEDQQAEMDDLKIMRKATMDMAKSKGYQPKYLTKVLQRRRKEREEVLEEDAILRALEEELGMDVLK